MSMKKVEKVFVVSALFLISQVVFSCNGNGPLGPAGVDAVETMDTAHADTATDTDTATDLVDTRASESVCTPDCTNKECGGNGCGGSCGQCSEYYQMCANGKCVDQPWCGDGTCESTVNETCATCPADCACKADQACFNATCCTPKTCTDLGRECGSGFDDTCGGKLSCGNCPIHQACQSGKCVAQPYCGNKTCDADQDEDCATCPVDCACKAGQACFNASCCTPKTCADLGKECGSGFDDTCGDKLFCGECPAHQACETGKCVDQLYCGNKTCDTDKDEDCATCAADCACKAGQTCFNASCCTPKTCADLGKECGSGFDDTCGGKLSCGNCPIHQACQSGKCVAQPYCGNGKCESGHAETCATCAADCACDSGQACFHAACCTPKTCADLGKECGSGFDDTCGGKLFCGDCPTHQACEAGKCVAQPYCGNKTCDADHDENCATCPVDCACKAGQTCFNAACCTPKTCADLGKECGSGFDDSCGGKLYCGECQTHQACQSGKCVDQPYCGNGTCDTDKDEDCATCPVDCGCDSGAACFNASCCTPKTCADLGKECGSGFDDTCGGKLFCGECPAHQACETGKCVAQPYCGNGTCDTDKQETCATCAADCACKAGQTCFNASCCTPKTCADLGKECGSGFDDTCGGKLFCGDCPTHQACEAGKCVDQLYCGNGTCDTDKDEDCATCAADCACKAGQTCFNAACCTPKTCDDLGKECGSGFDDTCGGKLFCGDCPAHQACETGKCVVQPYCGNGTCDTDQDEDCATCPADCACKPGQACFHASCCTPKTCTDLGKECGSGIDDTCGGKLFCGACKVGQTCLSGKCEGVWEDPYTGLMWQNPGSGNQMYWPDAMDYCNGLDYAGFTDWRLPTISELRTLIRGCAATVTGGSCKVTDNCLSLSCGNNPCYGCAENKGPGPGGAYWPDGMQGPDYWHWSSSSVADSPWVAWGVDFHSGYVYYHYYKAGDDTARCVRLGP